MRYSTLLFTLAASMESVATISGVTRARAMHVCGLGHGAEPECAGKLPVAGAGHAGDGADMSNPLQNNPQQRRSAGEKILSVVDVVMKICEALLGLFGRRSDDPKP